MHSILNCNLSNFHSDLQNVAIIKSIQTDEIFHIFGEKKPDSYVLYISKTIEDRNLKQSRKVFHIPHLLPVKFSDRSEREHHSSEKKNVRSNREFKLIYRWVKHSY